ncbi:MAG: YfbM family protein [Thermoanaerobacterales bacterium]|nr:YfbM family protein [Bacillota bacterium]MDI6907509.1 YfbM family protein [Thermoanaerobacterales bacterium]
MIGNYVRVSAQELEEALKDSSLISTLIFGEEEDEEDGKPRENTLEIDQAWHGIHFLLTGDPWAGAPPLSYVVLGGQPLGDDDLGYGPPHYLTPAQVREAAATLTQLSLDDLRQRYVPEKFVAAEIHPPIWDEGEEALEYILSYLRQVIDFFRTAAANGEAVIFWLE